MTSPTRSTTFGTLVVAGLVLAGQLTLVLLGPYTRAAGPAGGTAGPGGIALLSSDSLYYLELSRAADLLAEAPLTRIALPLILRMGDAIGSPEVVLVLVNAAALVLGGRALYDLGVRYGGSMRSGVLAATTFVMNPLTAQWMRFVLTETLGYAAVIGILWATIRHLESRGRGAIVLVVSLGSFLALLRPNGVLVLAGALSAILWHAQPTRRRGLRAIAAISAVWVAAGAMFLIGSGEPRRGDERTSQVVIDRLYSGVVVEGLPEVLVTAPMPPPEDVTDVSWGAAVGYVLDHPIATARLAIQRIIIETIQIRRHYPALVNVLVGLGFSTFLLAALVGVVVLPSRRIASAVVWIATPQALLVGATFAVPEARYGWTYLVTLCAWAGIGADRIVGTLVRPRRSGG